jgi:hypothetical protein
MSTEIELYVQRFRIFGREGLGRKSFGKIAMC